MMRHQKVRLIGDSSVFEQGFSDKWFGILFAAVDDIEEGKGVDEELELLPDAECELSEADKEQAILAKEAAEQETDEPAPVDATEDHEEESGMFCVRND